MSNITLRTLKEATPKHLRKNVTPELVETINSFSDPVAAEQFRDNLLGFTQVMSEGKFKMYQYVNAVKYVTYKLLQNTNKTAYIKTFPDTYARLVERGISEKDLSSYIHSYNKTKLVNLIYEQTFVPTYILNAPMFQEALNVQAELMLYAKSEKVRSDAANSILVHLKRPEVQHVDVNIGIKEDESVRALRDTTMALVRQQKAMLEAGQLNAIEVAHSPLVVEVIADTEED